MKRRDFILKSIGSSVAAGASFIFGKSALAFGNNTFGQDNGNYDLVAVKGDDPVKMFDEAIKALGGMEKFVKPGQSVVVKPNIGWDATPERAANTNPELVGRIVKSCYEAGASDVYVFDYTCNEWTKCYENSGIKSAVEDAGGKMVPGNTESFYKEIAIPKGKKLSSVKVHELILNSDVFINVPVLKHHSSGKLTIAMKNLMGIIWDRRYWHKNDLHQCIADFVTWCKPDLNIIDAYAVMKRNGPRGVSVDDVVKLNTLIISTDIVAADAAASKVFGYEPEDVPYIGIANDMGLGNQNLNELNIKRIKI
ncbi:DUF362 domain-containing protein [Bacteroidota bacterium]